MTIKKRLSVLLCVGILLAGLPLVASFGAVAASVPERQVVSYGLDVLASREEMVMAGLVGNEIGFTSEHIRRAMNLSELSYITVTELPSASKGTLYVGSVGVSKGQTVTAGNVGLMSFAPADDTVPGEATFRFTVNGGGYEMTCRLCWLAGINHTPTVSLVPAISLEVATYKNTPVYGCMSAYDPEDDELTYEVVRYAEHGRVTVLDKHTGSYVYTPDSGYVGNDQFTYVVRDQYGNYSTSVTVYLGIDAQPTSLSYADVDDSMYKAEILRISAAGIMNGTQVGNTCYFKPTESMKRGEFLMTVMNAAGIGERDVASYQTTGFSDDGDIPTAMKGYVALAAAREYITAPTKGTPTYFNPNAPISRAEAAVILSNVIGYANQTTVNVFADTDSMPAWSVDAFESLKSLGVLQSHDGNAAPGAAMTRADTAVWLTKTMQLMK